ncbi:MAG: glycosyltransferase [Acidimicrobiia bacterium]
MTGRHGMHLAIVTKDLTGGGAARAMVKLANGLAARHRVELVLVRAVGPYLEEVSPEVEVVDLGARRTIAAIPRLVGYLRKDPPHAMLSALRHVNVMSIISRLLARASCCLVVSERNMISVSVRSSPRWRDRLFVILIPLLYRFADAIVAIASDIRDELQTRFRISSQRIHLIYNPIVGDELFARAKEAVDEPWFSEEVPTVLAVGRLTEHKNHQLLVKAFRRVLEEQQARLVILGEGPERQNLSKLVRELGIGDEVAMPGFVPNVYKFMSRSDLFVHPSRWEGLPGVLIEAMACGLPIVASDALGGSAEVLAHGRHGRLVEPDNEAALVEAILDGLRGRIPPADRSGWARFEQASVVSQYEALLRRCAG